MVAAVSGDGASIETFDLLLSLGALPRQRMRTRSAARFAAAGLGWNYQPGGDAQRLRRCLELGCDPDETDFRGVTLLADAARTGDVERVHVLLAAGASPDPAGPPGTGDPGTAAGPRWFQIPVFAAAGRGDAEMTRLLLDAGADPAATDHRGRTALFAARGQAAVLLLVAAGADLTARDEQYWAPLDDAVADGDIERAAGLLAAGADVNASHEGGYPAVLHAVSSHSRSLPMMRLLIEAGADPHAVTALGWNAFHAAVDVNGSAANSEESVRDTLGFLRHRGVDINHRDRDGSTPLQRAQAYGTPTEVRVLREMGAR